MSEQKTDGNVLGEFEQIATLMAPLAENAKGAFALKNDGAVFDCLAGDEIVVTTDTLIAGVHFFETDCPQDIAAKVLGVNLSDLASMGATPCYYTLNASYPANISTEWIKSFADELSSLQTQYGIHLLGGDTTCTPGPLCMSLTAFGTVKKGTSLQRTSARVGDLVCVSGTIGDGALGLLVAQGKFHDPTGSLLQRYRRPEPKIELGKALIGLATACLDISDGLLADLGHLEKSVDIETSKIPLSDAAKSVLAQDSSLMDTILNGGDDYELLFCLPADYENKLFELSQIARCQLSVIGRIKEAGGLCLIDKSGVKIPVSASGYRHF